MYPSKTLKQLNKPTQRGAESVKRHLCYSHKTNEEEVISTKEKTLHNLNFETLLLEAIDETLYLLGDSWRLATYYHLESAFEIDRQDIPNKIDELSNAIKKIFGLRAKFFFIEIMKGLYKKVGSNFKYFPKVDDLIFTDYVAAVRLSLKRESQRRPRLHVYA